VCYCALQYGAVCCSVLPHCEQPFGLRKWLDRALAVHAVCCSVLQRVTACCSVLQRVAACYNVLQCVTVRCSMVQCIGPFESSSLSCANGSIEPLRCMKTTAYSCSRKHSTLLLPREPVLKLSMKRTYVITQTNKHNLGESNRPKHSCSRAISH